MTDQLYQAADQAMEALLRYKHHKATCREWECLAARDDEDCPEAEALRDESERTMDRYQQLKAAA